MKNKNKKNIFIIVGIILFLLLLSIVLNIFKAEDLNVVYSENTISQVIHKNKMKDFNNKQLSDSILEENNGEQLSNTQVVAKNNNWKNVSEQKFGIPCILDAFYSDYGWISKVTNFTEHEVTVELTNTASEELIVNTDFIGYIGNDAEGSEIQSEIVGGEVTIKPNETKKVTVKHNGQAQFFGIGLPYASEDIIFYRMKTFLTRADDPYAPSIDQIERFEVSASPVISSFEELNVLPITTNFLAENKYGEIKITSQEKKNYPNALILSAKYDIFNKQEENNLVIDSASYVITDGVGDVVQKQKINFKNTIYSKQRQSIQIPFKYLSGNYCYKIILHTNVGDIQLLNPDTNYGMLVENR